MRIGDIEGGRLVLNEVDGVMWVSDSYWAVAVPDRTHPAACLLDSYNIPLKPVCCAVGSTIRMVEGPPPDIAKLVAARDGIKPIKPRCIKGEPLFIFDHSDQALALYDLPGGGIGAYRRSFLRLVELMAPGEWYGGPDPMKPIHRLHGGVPTAMLMGVKSQVSQ